MLSALALFVFVNVCCASVCDLFAAVACIVVLCCCLCLLCYCSLLIWEIMSTDVLCVLCFFSV